MEQLDLDIIKIKYDKQERFIINHLLKILNPVLDMLKKECYPYHEIECQVFFLPNSDLNQLYQNALHIIEQILKEYILECYKPLISKLAIVLLKYQNQFPIEEWQEYLCQEIIHPEDKPFTLEDEVLKELQIAFLCLTHPFDLITYLSAVKIDRNKLIEEAYQYMIENYRILDSQFQTPEDILKYTWQNIKYGSILSSGEIIETLPKNWYQEYVIYPTKKILEKHYGCCIDMARVDAMMLKKLHYRSIVRIYKYYRHFHAYTLYKQNGIWYRMDPLYKNNPPIIKVGNLEEDKQMVYLETQDKLHTEIYELPENIDYQKFSQVFENCKTLSYTRHKTLANPNETGYNNHI